MRARALIIFLAALLLASAPALAATARELSVSLAAGGFFSSDSAYRQIYGSGPAIAGDVWLKLIGPFGLAAGFSSLSDKGIAVPLDQGTVEYPLEIRRTTVPVMAFYQIDAGPATVRLGAGAGFHSYKEVWPTADLDYKGNKVAPRLALTVLVRVIGRLSLLGAACYEPIPTGAGTFQDRNIDLGGFQVLGGLSFRIL